MAKKTKIDYLPLFEKYERGEITATEIARQYGVNRTSFLDCYRRYKANLDKNISDTAEHLDKGLKAFKNAVDNINAKEREISQMKDGFSKEQAIKENNANKNALKNTLDLLDKHHGVLAQAAISIVGKSLKKANEMLDIVETPSEYASVMNAFKSSCDTIGLFPKMPLVAIQNNINTDKAKNEAEKSFEVKINFLNAKKKDDKDEVINAEVVDEK